MALLVLDWPAIVFALASTMPRINDITTDAQSPPRLVELAQERPKDANPVEYAGPRVSRVQLETYPDIRPVVIPRPAQEAFDLLLETVRRMHWTLVAQRPPQGRGKPGIIEATDRTLVLGFTDDIVIRVNGDENETRVDVRSASRYGAHDFGRNATRVRSFFKELQDRVDATVTGRRPGHRRARPGVAVPRRGKGAPVTSAGPQKSQSRAQPGAQRAPPRKERPRSRGEDQGRDRRSERSA